MFAVLVMPPPAARRRCAIRYKGMPDGHGAVLDQGRIQPARINDEAAMVLFLPWFGVAFFLAAADWHDGGSPPSWRRRASPSTRGDASHARIGSHCDRARTRFWRSQNCPRSTSDGLRPRPAFRWLFLPGTKW